MNTRDAMPMTNVSSAAARSNHPTVVCDKDTSTPGVADTCGPAYRPRCSRRVWPEYSVRKRAALLQQRHHPVDELVEPAWGEVRHQDEAVAGVGLHVQVDLVGDLCRSADELLAAGDGDDQLADGQVLGLRTLAPCGGDGLGVTVPDAALGDRGIVGRFDVGQRAVGVVCRTGRVATPARASRSRSAGSTC